MKNEERKNIHTRCLRQSLFVIVECYSGGGDARPYTKSRKMYVYYIIINEKNHTKNSRRASMS